MLLHSQKYVNKKTGVPGLTVQVGATSRVQAIRTFLVLPVAKHESPTP